MSDNVGDNIGSTDDIPQPRIALLNSPISSILDPLPKGFTKRAQEYLITTLSNENFSTIADLCTKSESEMLKLRGYGRKQHALLKASMKRYRLSFR